MDKNKFLSLLGMCRKAGRLSCGHDRVVESIRQGKAELCLLSSDSSDRLRKEIRTECEKFNSGVKIEVIDFDMLEIGQAVGLKSAVVSVNDSGFARSLINLIGRTNYDI